MACADDEQVVMCPAWTRRRSPRARSPSLAHAGSDAPGRRVLRADRAGRGVVRHDDDVRDPDDRPAGAAARDRLAAGALRAIRALLDRAVRRAAVRRGQRRRPAQRVAQRRAHARAAAHAPRRAWRARRTAVTDPAMLAEHRRGADRVQPDRRRGVRRRADPHGPPLDHRGRWQRVAARLAARREQQRLGRRPEQRDRADSCESSLRLATASRGSRRAPRPNPVATSG